MNVNCYPISSGISSLDRITGGLRPSELIIMIGRPAAGKSVLALNIAYNVAEDNDIPVAFFSMEMPAISMAKQLLQMAIGRYDKTEHIEWMQLQSALKHLAYAPLYVDDTRGLQIPDFRFKAERLVEQKKVRLLIIDDLQLFSYRELPGVDHKEKLDNLLLTLKDIAVSTGVPIIVCSQISRFDNRKIGNNCPDFSDLSDFDYFRKNADSLLLIHRYPYFENSNITKLIIGKLRDKQLAETFAINLMFQDDILWFSEL